MGLRTKIEWEGHTEATERTEWTPSFPPGLGGGLACSELVLPPMQGD